MATGLSIEPFPSDIDRDSFGHYLSGFTDGEGCFFLGLTSTGKGHSRKTPKPIFAISLRADDLPILRLIQSFLRCGRISPTRARPSHGSQDSFRLRIDRVSDLMLSVIPHFDRYPLRAKKSRDFVLWRQGVQWVHQVTGAPRVRTPSGRHAVYWNDERLAHYLFIMDALKSLRVYNGSSAVVPVLPPASCPTEPSLFDAVDD